MVSWQSALFLKKGWWAGGWRRGEALGGEEGDSDSAVEGSEGGHREDPGPEPQRAAPLLRG